MKAAVAVAERLADGTDGPAVHSSNNPVCHMTTAATRSSISPLNQPTQAKEERARLLSDAPHWTQKAAAGGLPLKPQLGQR